MGWTAPAAIGTDWSVGEIATAAKMNSHLSDNLRYLKGSDGAITLDNDLGVGDSTISSDWGPSNRNLVVEGAAEDLRPCAHGRQVAVENQRLDA